MAPKYKNPYASENELCEAFTAFATHRGWRVFPETAGFDLLLVATRDVVLRGVMPGDQIGVEAKLSDNVEVLYQALPRNDTAVGPNFHAVLVPRAKPAFTVLARRLGIVAFEGCGLRWNSERWDRREWTRDVFAFHPLLYQSRHYYTEACWHPEIDVWVPPGVSGPRRITPWKVAAVKLCLHGKTQGYLTSDDFRTFGISMSRWVRGAWVVATGEKRGRRNLYVVNESNTKDPPPHLRWPEIADALRHAKSTALT